MTIALVVVLAAAGGVGLRLLTGAAEARSQLVRIVASSVVAEIAVHGELDGDCVEAPELDDCLPVVTVTQRRGAPLRAAVLTGVVTPGTVLLYWGCREGAGVTECTPRSPGPDTAVCVTTSDARDASALAFCGRFGVAATGRPTRDRTEVVEFVPVTRDGRPAAGHVVVDQGTELLLDSCSSAFAATASDIVSCGPTAASAQACWIETNRATVLCGRPGDNRLYRFGVRQALPRYEPLPEARREPLAIELRDGTICTRRTGGPAPPLPEPFSSQYWCGEHGLAVQAHGEDLLDRSSPFWTLRTMLAAAADGGDPVPIRREVALVHYAGRP
ncbi:hypothetical protein D2L64_08010 [Micromonospora radicis]|uniref:Uncharacterized protein n=1 Tax=Micromonospora radicis TaxID=1894971 RepID=A0A418MYI9_9ACTN|nr:hypothetical protein D2L64_08010 [Micromonospora radicis]